MPKIDIFLRKTDIFYLTKDALCAILITEKEMITLKILYRQAHTETDLARLGFLDCCLKKLRFSEDSAVTTPKKHCHGEYEIHFVMRGGQTYEAEGKIRKTDAARCLLLPPGICHRAMDFEAETEKYALSVRFEPSGSMRLPQLSSVLLPFTARMKEALVCAEAYTKEESEASKLLAEHRLAELLMELFRAVGLQEEACTEREEREPPILTVAKQYIRDNVRSALTVSEVAQYAHISEKQLSRIFLQYEGVSVFDCIRTARVACAKELLADGNRSLREISEELHFGSEYSFNHFFKTNYGMTPGAYRRML